MSTVLITGAGRGIGLELCRLFKNRGDRVIAACRQSSPELDALETEVYRHVEVTDDASVDGLAKALGSTQIDLLINNAGILTVESLGDLDFERVRQQFEVNALGPLRVTLALLPHLRSGSKVAIVSSQMGSIADNTSGSYYGYRMSKAAVNIAGSSLAHDLRERGIPVVLLHPGLVATEMTTGQGIAPAEAARGLITRIDELNMDHSGSFWRAAGGSLPW